MIIEFLDIDTMTVRTSDGSIFPIIGLFDADDDETDEVTLNGYAIVCLGGEHIKIVFAEQMTVN